MTRERQSNSTHRWYLCECGAPGCREEFYMRITDYESNSLVEGARVVVPGHVPANWAITPAGEGALLTRPGKRGRG